MHFIGIIKNMGKNKLKHLNPVPYGGIILFYRYIHGVMALFPETSSYLEQHIG